MRFSTLSSALFAFFLLASEFTNVKSYHYNLIRRDDDASSSQMAEPVYTKTSDTHGSTSSSAAQASINAKAKKGKATQFGNFASPSILQGGTLFYIGVSVTTLLWVASKVIEVKTERQERYAERVAH